MANHHFDDMNTCEEFGETRIRKLAKQLDPSKRTLQDTRSAGCDCI